MWHAKSPTVFLALNKPMPFYYFYYYFIYLTSLSNASNFVCSLPDVPLVSSQEMRAMITNHAMNGSVNHCNMNTMVYLC